MTDHIVELVVFVILFLAIAVMGFWASRWKAGETMAHLDEWGLGGRKFGTWVSWFLIGGDLYTAYTFVAVPALMFGAGAMGFFAVPYTVVLYPLVFLFLARLWSVSHRHGFVTSADFVRARFDSRTLALVVALTGLIATMPYVALQLVGVQAVLATMGIGGKWPLTIAFVVLALFTYTSGLRAPALIAFVKDSLIYLVILVAVIYIPLQVGGNAKIFSAASEKLAGSPDAGPILAGPSQMLYITLALGSAMALMLYPHSTTAILAAKSRDVVKRNMALLPLYSLLLGLLALLGYIAIATKVTPVPGDTSGNTIVPRLFDQQFPGWFAGIAFAAIGIGALVPAAIMSIAAANTFTRNIYKEYFRPDATPKEETAVAKIVSLVVKFGALGFVIFLNPSFAIDLQLIGGVIILQTLPAVGIGLFTRWFHRGALIAGWAVGMIVALKLLYDIPKKDPATGEIVKAHFGGSGYPLANLGLDTDVALWAGIIAIAANLLVAVVLTVVLRALKVSDGVDATSKADYFAEAGEPGVKVVEPSPEPVVG
ncbi:MAG TPA: sodium:solute symporter family protein [Nocardioidaceae bacterium]